MTNNHPHIATPCELQSARQENIRLKIVTLNFVEKLQEKHMFAVWRFRGIGSDKSIIDIPSALILNIEELEKRIKINTIVKVVMPEYTNAFGLCIHGITCTRQIKLPS